LNQSIAPPAAGEPATGERQAPAAARTAGSRALALSAMAVQVRTADPDRSAALAAEALTAAETLAGTDHARLLPVVAAVLGADGHWDQAQRAALVGEISLNQMRPLRSLIDGMVADHQWEPARTTAQALDGLSGAYAACEIAAGMAKVGLWGQAEEIAWAIDNP